MASECSAETARPPRPIARSPEAGRARLESVPLSRTPAQSQEARRRWAEVIRTTWAKATEAIIETGKQLIAAKDDLGHGGFHELAPNGTRFGWATADRLMAIARHSVLSNSAHAQSLPAHWTTLYELSRLRAKRLLALIQDGTIHPGLERQQAERLVANEIARTMPGHSSGTGAAAAGYRNPTRREPRRHDGGFSVEHRAADPDTSVPTEDVPAALHKIAAQTTGIIEPPVDRYAILLAAWEAAGEPDRRRFLMWIGAHLVAEAER